MTVNSFMPSCGTTLNIGCGTFQYFLQNSGIMINCDIDRKNAENFIQCRAEKLPFLNDTFDSIIAFDVIEHLADEKIFLTEAARILKGSGKLYLTTPCSEDDFLLIEIPKKISWRDAENDWGHKRRGYTVNEFSGLIKHIFLSQHLERFGGTFARIGYQLYYLRRWYKFWRKYSPVKLFLRCFNILDYYLCRGIGHMIFAILVLNNKDGD